MAWQPRHVSPCQNPDLETLSARAGTTASGTAPPAPPTWTAVDATFRLMGNGLLPFNTSNQARAP